MKNIISLLLVGFMSSVCFAEDITVTLFEEVVVTLSKDVNIKGKSDNLSKLPNNSLQGLLDFKEALILELPDDVVLEIDITDNGETSAQMNGLSTLNWLTVISAYTGLLQKQVKAKQERGYKTVSTLTGEKVGNYRAMVSRVGWLTDKGINNLFIFDIFHKKTMLSLKLTWISDPKTDAETIADQVISSVSVK